MVAVCFSVERLTAWVTKAKSLAAAPAAIKPLQQAKKPMIHPPIHFEFYDELSKPIPITDSAAATGGSLLRVYIKTVASPETKYVLQLGVFKDETTANEMRISLLLAGIDADLLLEKQNGRPV